MDIKLILTIIHVAASLFLLFFSILNAFLWLLKYKDKEFLISKTLKTLLKIEVWLGHFIKASALFLIITDFALLKELRIWLHMFFGGGSLAGISVVGAQLEKYKVGDKKALLIISISRAIVILFLILSPIMLRI